MLGFKAFRTAAKITSGIETMHMINKGEMRCPNVAVMSAADPFYSLAVKLLQPGTACKAHLCFLRQNPLGRGRCQVLRDLP
jgi:hypothetical protein